MEKDIEEAQVTILLEIDNKIHLVGMRKDRLDAISLIIKKGVEVAIPTNKSQRELNVYLGYEK